MVRRALLAASLVVLVGAADAQACSCAYSKPRAALRSADYAFTGRLVEVRRRFSMRAVYTFRVEHALKGDFGKRVRVRAPGPEPSCGLAVEVGERTGLILDRDRHDRWRSSLCMEYGAHQLERASRGMSTKPHPRCAAEDADFHRAVKRLVALVSQPLLPAPVLRFLGPTGRLTSPRLPI
jgi:hypothetical protein